MSLAWKFLASHIESMLLELSMSDCLARVSHAGSFVTINSLGAFLNFHNIQKRNRGAPEMHGVTSVFDFSSPNFPHRSHRCRTSHPEFRFRPRVGDNQVSWLPPFSNTTVKPLIKTDRTRAVELVIVFATARMTYAC